MEEVTQAIEEPEVAPPLVEKKRIPPKKGIQSYTSYICKCWFLCCMYSCMYSQSDMFYVLY